MSVVVDRFPAPQGRHSRTASVEGAPRGSHCLGCERIYSDRSEVRVYIGADMPLCRAFGDAEAAHRHATDLLSQFERQGGRRTRWPGRFGTSFWLRVTAVTPEPRS